MPNLKDNATAENFMELQIAVAKSVRCLKIGDYSKAEAHLRSCNPFLKSIEADCGIADIDDFIGSFRIGSGS